MGLGGLVRPIPSSLQPRHHTALQLYSGSLTPLKLKYPETKLQTLCQEAYSASLQVTAATACRTARGNQQGKGFDGSLAVCVLQGLY